MRSFGTEDRPTQYSVPAQTQIYEYILFRGSDIKDISIVNTQQLPNDPAIVSNFETHFQESIIVLTITYIDITFHVNFGKYFQ